MLVDFLWRIRISGVKTHIHTHFHISSIELVVILQKVGSNVYLLTYYRDLSLYPWYITVLHLGRENFFISGFFVANF